MNSFCVIPILVQKIFALQYITLHLPSFISQVPANTITEANKPSLSPEEMKIKAQELRERARKKKEEEERRMEREREKVCSQLLFTLFNVFRNV
jgi:hypothetical protein